MIFPVDYVGCEIIVRDITASKTLAKSTIVKYERGTGTILISGKISSEKSDEKVSLIILSDKAVYEYKGTVRKRSSENTTEISLFDGKLKEERAAKRYALNTSAFIDTIKTHDEITTLEDPIEITILNLSTSGVLISVPNGYLEEGSEFQIKIKIENQDVIINSAVVRIKNSDDKNTEYACKFLSLAS